jgi:hypothetical protein
MVRKKQPFPVTFRHRGMKNAYKLIGILFAIFTLPGIASACLCGGPFPVDVEFGRNQTVGVFKVVSTETLAQPQKEGNLPGRPSYLIKLSVEKVFKGALKQGQEVTLSHAGITDCDRHSFIGREGTEFLLFVASDPAANKGWNISGCSRSEEIGKASADLLWLDNLDALRGKTRLSGTVKQYFDTAGKTELLAGSPVLITGNGKTIEIATDQNGVYEIYDLAPGKYRVTPVRIEGFSAGEKGYEEVEIKAGAHTEKNFFYRMNKVEDAASGAEGARRESCIFITLTRH